jgi:cation-transporting ATPase 13A3/4/5
LTNSSSVGRTHAYKKLSEIPPPTSLIGITQLSSIVIQLAAVIIFQIGTVLLLWQQKSWYVPHDPEDEDDYACHDNYAVFGIQVFQYITLTITFSKGSPYREPFYKNSNINNKEIEKEIY